MKPLWWIFSCKHKPKWISRHILISCTCSQIYVNSNSNYGTLKILHPYKFPIESSIISSSLVSQSWIFGLSRLSYLTTPTNLQLSLSYYLYSARRFLPSTNQLSNLTWFSQFYHPKISCLKTPSKCGFPYRVRDF